MERGEPGRRASGRCRCRAELFQLLSACLEYSRQSEGAFDITVGPLMKVWGFYKGSGRLPHRAEVRAALAQVGYRHVLLDPANADGAVRPARAWKSIRAASARVTRWTGWWRC